MLVLFKSKKTDDDLYSTLPDVLSSSDALPFPDGVPGQRGRKKSEMSALWLNHQGLEQRSVTTARTTDKHEYASLRKENQRLRTRLSVAEERIKVLETLCKQNQIDIPAQVTKRAKDTASVSSIASTVVIGSSSTSKIDNLSKSNTAKVKSFVKRSNSLSLDNTPASTPTSSPPRSDDSNRELRVRFLMDEVQNHNGVINYTKSRSRAHTTSSYLDETLEGDMGHEIPKISRITNASTFDLNPSPFRSCIESLVSSKKRTERGRKLSISSYDDVYSPPKEYVRSVITGVRSCIKESSYQGRNDTFNHFSNSRITGKIDRAEI